MKGPLGQSGDSREHQVRRTVCRSLTHVAMQASNFKEDLNYPIPTAVRKKARKTLLDVTVMLTSGSNKL
eukprot:1096868-Amphidinium_carterae.1